MNGLALALARRALRLPIFLAVAAMFVWPAWLLLAWSAGIEHEVGYLTVFSGLMLGRFVYRSIATPLTEIFDNKK